MLTLFPLYLLTLRLFRPTTAVLAVFLWLLLPMPFTIGHETLADATGLCFMAWAIWLGSEAMRSSSARARAAWASCAGIAAACAYWTRPEGLLVAVSVGSALAVFGMAGRGARLAGVVPFCGIFAASAVMYLTINGALSDRLEAFLAQPTANANTVTAAVAAGGRTEMPRGLPEALRDPRYEFSPKDPLTERTRPGLKSAAFSILRQWSESLGIALAVMTIWGLVRTRAQDLPSKRLVSLHAAILLAALTLQAGSWLSIRHVAGLTFLSVPFAAAALRLCGLRLAAVLRLNHAGDGSARGRHWRPWPRSGSRFMPSRSMPRGSPIIRPENGLRRMRRWAPPCSIRVAGRRILRICGDMILIISRRHCRTGIRSSGWSKPKN
jgi:hypothetical protein